MGLDVPAGRIVLAGATALREIAARRPRARVLMLASEGLTRHARDVGLRPVRTQPHIVFLGRDRRFSHRRLEMAANVVRAGAELVVANPDLVHPGPGGSIVPETGALLAALLASTGPVSYRVVGKPEPALFEAGLALLGLPRCDVAMLGDNPRTDGEGARRFGIRYVDVAGGFFLRIEAETACPPPPAWSPCRRNRAAISIWIPIAMPESSEATRRSPQERFDGVIERLTALRPGLPPTAARIAEFFLGHAAEGVHMSVTEVAERTEASEGSVISLCRLLGARGFQQVKIALARDLVQPVQFIHEISLAATTPGR